MPLSLFLFSPTDYNECTVDNGGCEQKCVNVIPAYECQCYTGYSLDSDKSSCVVNAVCDGSQCECLDGFVDENSDSTGNVSCVGKFTLLTPSVSYATYVRFIKSIF